MEWVLSLAISLASIMIMIGMYKNKLSVLEENDKVRSQTVSKIFDRLDKHGDDIVSLNTRSSLAMTSKDVDDKYVSKELFRQFEKHIDKRFDRIDEYQIKILAFIDQVSKRNNNG